jgi:predicted NBD/HSP70 family sugar kinase
MSERLTLSIDCGGLFLKSCVLDDSGTMHSKPNRIETPYPLSPERFVETIAGIAADLPKSYRATVGMPGMIRNGVVVATPHYITIRNSNLSSQRCRGTWRRNYYWLWLRSSDHSWNGFGICHFLWREINAAL